MSKAFLLCMLFAVFLAGCDKQQAMERFVPKDEERVARQYVEDLRTGKFDVFEKDMDPSLQTPQMAAVIRRIGQALFPGETPKSVKIVKSYTNVRGDTATYGFGYEYEFKGGWRYADIALQKTSGKNKIIGIHAQFLTTSIEQANAFTLKGKPLLQIILFFLGVLLCCFTLVTAVVCWKTPIPKRKWLWMIFVILGFGQINLNWATGAYFMQLGVQLFGFGFTQQLYGPWIVQVGLPVGAIIFWFKRSKWKTEATVAL